MDTPLHPEDFRRVAKLQTRGIAADRAAQIVERSVQAAREQVFIHEEQGKRYILVQDLDSGRVAPLMRSELGDIDAHLEEERRLRVGELIERAVRKEQGGDP